MSEIRSFMTYHFSYKEDAATPAEEIFKLYTSTAVPNGWFEFQFKDFANELAEFFNLPEGRPAMTYIYKLAKRAPGDPTGFPNNVDVRRAPRLPPLGGGDDRIVDMIIQVTAERRQAYKGAALRANKTLKTWATEGLDAWLKAAGAAGGHDDSEG